MLKKKKEKKPIIPRTWSTWVWLTYEAGPPPSERAEEILEVSQTSTLRCYLGAPSIDVYGIMCPSLAYCVKAWQDMAKEHESEEDGYGFYPLNVLLTSIIQELVNLLDCRNKLLVAVQAANVDQVLLKVH
ncbi:hypothetical protein AVEN_225306-1 [Araneus ventricosus]|uniref:Uncharacterized protein n=1 Tax=Araneus ventricosus TaxID=182803 RepID=A0A4Y2AMZ0_ARAVE|nr:hypothetical protein AVEN_225306-1 [Araneus ventricosus]